MRFGTLAQYFNNSGNVLAAGTLGFYASGSSESPSNLIDIFSDINQTIPITNPVTLDAYGRQPDVFFTGSALAVLRSSAGVLMDQEDPVGQTTVDSQFTDWIDSFSYPLYAVVLYMGKYYESIQTPNFGNQPDTSPLYWQLFINESLKDQTVVAAKSVAVGNATTGLAGIAISNGRLVIGDTTNGIAALDVTAKGSIAVGNATTMAALAVGANNYVLTADSAQTAGIKWAAASTSGVVLLATLTPTAAANVDALSTFTSSYDAYLIECEGLAPASYAGSPKLTLRLAVAGSADTGSNYVALSITVPASTTATAFPITPSAMNVGTVNATIKITNANDATNHKTIIPFGSQSTSSGPDTFVQIIAGAVYIAADAVSGIRLYWSSGANFVAQGKVRIYGMLN